MNTRVFAVIVALAAGTVAGFAQQGEKPQPVPSISQRPSGASLGTIRIGAADTNIWFGWRVAMPANAIKGMALSDVLARADAPLGLAGVEAQSTVTVAYEVPKPLDHRLQSGERDAINYRLRELNQQILVYRVDNFPSDEPTRRRVFELAKALNAPGNPPLVIIPADAPNVAGVDTLAQELGLNVALDSRADPTVPMAALKGRSSRLGVSADLGGWMQAGIKPIDGLATVKDKLLHVRVSDRSAMGAKSRAVALGEGAGALSDFFLAIYKAGIKPLFTIETIGATEADMMRNLQAFERAMWPAMAERVRVMLTTPAGQIRGGDRLDAATRAQIDAGAPRQPIATPKRARKLLVTDIQMYSGHSTIPHGNLMLELMSKYTGAFDVTFSNDLNLLKYPKIKEFDAVFLNNVCGMVHNDPEVRDGVMRFVREGGGIGGNHAVTYANNNWPEFSDMMGGWSGAHHVEKQMLKIDDPSSPLMKPFGTESFEHTDEFYIFPPHSPYSREKSHVLMSIDVEKSDRATAGRLCAQCTRPDQDYGVAWVKAFGKGRTYFTPLGHTTIMYTDKRWTQHILAAVQYILGDLEVDATPGAKTRRTN
jgi:type 1 glutamine amidotransferase/sugar phosphate isomerase/epimerase